MGVAPGIITKLDNNHLSHQLTHWGRVTHICVGKTTIIGLDNGLSPGRRQAIIWTNAGILSIGPLGTNFSEFLVEIYTFSFKKIHLKVSSGKWRPSFLGLNVLKQTHCSRTRCISMTLFTELKSKCTLHLEFDFAKWTYLCLVFACLLSVRFRYFC